ncbi:hypothetical protein CR513_21932, partial [Mucuna pruriens]
MNIIIIYYLAKQKDYGAESNIYIPEETAIVDDSSAVAGGAVADLDGGNIEASKTVFYGQIVSALKHCIRQYLSPRLLCYAKRRKRSEEYVQENQDNASFGMMETLLFYLAK